jgi:hypothetical protein
MKLKWKGKKFAVTTDLDTDTVEKTGIRSINLQENRSDFISNQKLVLLF